MTKVQLTLKLLLLENARNAVEQELRDLTKKAYQDVQGFLKSSCPSTEFIDLSSGLDVKCQVMQSLSTLLKNFTVEPKVDVLPRVKYEVRTMMDVVKFGPKLKSSFMASSISNPKPTTILPPMRSGWEGDMQVHQKQTSTQLLHYLKRKSVKVDAPEVFVMKWNVVPDDLEDTLSPKTLQMQKQSADFILKQAESNKLTYQSALATETELWDIGDIFIKDVQGESEPSPPIDDDYHDVTAQLETSHEKNRQKTQSFECTEAQHETLLAKAKMQTLNRVNIPQFLIQRFEETEVVVSHIVDPGDFYIQNTDSPEKLQSLIMDSWKAGSSCAEQNCIPDLGTLVMGWFPEQEQWCRVQVTKICGISREDQIANDGGACEASIQVEVKRLDHGDTACLSLRNIKELTPEMASLPLQALQVSLANVTPVNGSHWSEESVAWFKAIVHNRTFYARFYPQWPKFTVELFLEKGNRAVLRRSASLSLRLAQSGYAVHNKLRKPAVMKRSRYRSAPVW